jgi:hypothetical protein
MEIRKTKSFFYILKEKKTNTRHYNKKDNFKLPFPKKVIPETSRVQKLHVTCKNPKQYYFEINRELFFLKNIEKYCRGILKILRNVEIRLWVMVCYLIFHKTPIY